jgi:16S rRNA C967 or C1407 C5-methylase (RsmB/RsmF family)/NOL1/NOP2/fmu family ribosome biogenesis protein
MKLPIPFLQDLEKALGSEITSFQKAFEHPSPTSIRFNKTKQNNWSENSEGVKWNDDGVYLKERPIFTFDPAFHAGAYYVQEASSMFVKTAVEQVLSLDQPLKVLDLCAAPGGKSTLLISLLTSDGLLLANEIIAARYKILKENLMKWGNPNIAISNHKVTDLEKLEHFFDLILIDAPCSGEGLFRKDEKAIGEWSPSQVTVCANRQKEILKSAEKLLKKDGIFVYSTCTYNNQENMDNVAWLAEQHALQSVQLDLEEDWQIVEKEKNGQYGYQFYPHRVKGEGFFISVLKKTGGESPPIKKQKGKKASIEFQNLKKLPKKQVATLTSWLKTPDDFAFYLSPSEQVLALPKSLLNAYQTLDQSLKKKQFGISIGQFKGHDFIPSHQLALSNIIHPDLPAIEVDKAQALLFLKKENLKFKTNTKGWQLIRFQGLNLGWVKVLPNRINNYLPKEYRIRMALP